MDREEDRGFAAEALCGALLTSRETLFRRVEIRELTREKTEQRRGNRPVMNAVRPLPVERFTRRVVGAGRGRLIFLVGKCGEDEFGELDARDGAIETSDLVEKIG